MIFNIAVIGTEAVGLGRLVESLRPVAVDMRKITTTSKPILHHKLRCNTNNKSWGCVEFDIRILHEFGGHSVEVSQQQSFSLLPLTLEISHSVSASDKNLTGRFFELRCHHLNLLAR